MTSHHAANRAALRPLLAAQYDWQEGDLEWARIPEAEERVTRTFCGT